MGREPKLTWREDPGAAKMVLDAIRGEMIHPRLPSDTVSVTELIYCLTKSWFGRYADVFEEKNIKVAPTDDEVEIWALGIGLEEVLLRSHKRHETGVFEGIRYELDVLLNFGPDGELKTTRISTKNLPWKTDRTTKKREYNVPEGWEKQVLAYYYIRRALNRTEDTEMLFIPWHLMGGYAPPFPEVKAWRVAPIGDAAEQNWAWLQERRAVLEAHIQSGSPPTPFQHMMEYECEGCRLKMLCDSLTYAQKQLAVIA